LENNARLIGSGQTALRPESALQQAWASGLAESSHGGTGRITFWFAGLDLHRYVSPGANRAKRLILWQAPDLRMAGRQGFEPRYADPESAVLPLDDLPVISQYHK
jgi:hypothetical protein